MPLSRSVRPHQRAVVAVTLLAVVAACVVVSVRARASATEGVISGVAGNGVGGFGGDGGPAVDGSLRDPDDVAVADDGSLFIADTANHRIRRVGPAGTISTVAGTGSTSFSGDGGLATEAGIESPAAVALDGDGNLYIADSGNSRVRRVDPDGKITTVAGTGTKGFSGDGGPATAARLQEPGGLAVAADGSLYLSDNPQPTGPAGRRPRHDHHGGRRGRSRPEWRPRPGPVRRPR